MPIIPVPPYAPAVLTCLDIIMSSLRLVGILGGGETPNGTDANAALMALQGMWDQWNAERLMIFTVPRNVYPVNAGQQTYTIGIDPEGTQTANISVPRPPAIERMGIINLNNPQQPLELPLQYLTVAQWQEIPVKNIQSALPQYCWDDNGFPFRTLSLWPVPNVALQMAIYPWSALTAPAQLTTLMAFPPGYQKAFRFNLAVDLAAEFPPVDPQILQAVAANAIESKRIVKAINTPILDLRCDPAVTAQSSDYLYNWISDQPSGR
jgi:hypothetical protein